MTVGDLKRIKYVQGVDELSTRFEQLVFRSNKRRLVVADYVSPVSALDQALASKSDDALLRGHEVMDAIRDNLALIDEKWGSRPGERFERSHDQRIMHEKIMVAVTKFVYGPGFASNELKIKKYNRIEKIYAAIAFSAPRRFGKSMTIAIICAAMFMAVPNMEIAIVAQGARAAGKKAGMLGLIKVILLRCFGLNKYDTADAEHLINFFPDRRAIHSYSSKAGDG